MLERIRTAALVLATITPYALAACSGEQAVEELDSGRAGDAGVALDATSGADATATTGDDAASADAEATVDAGPSPTPDGGVVPDAGPLAHFSFFVTSLVALQDLSASPDGFGGDLRFGESGPGAGLRGADKICTAIAERSMPGSGTKVWRAFLSARADENGSQVDAIDRIGGGPWYDRLGRLFALNTAALLHTRPTGDATIINDFPNEDGVPNHQPDPTQGQVDNHDMLTGSNAQGRLYGNTATCLDWTSATGDRNTEGRPRVGHSWPRRIGGGGGGGGMDNWMSALDESGCAAGVSLVEMGPPIDSIPTVGSGGGYGGFYCFALSP